MLGTDKVHRVYITLDHPGTRALESQLMKQNIHGYEIASWFNLDKRKKDNYVLYLFFKSVILMIRASVQFCQFSVQYYETYQFVKVKNPLSLLFIIKSLQVYISS